MVTAAHVFHPETAKKKILHIIKRIYLIFKSFFANRHNIELVIFCY